ncbi:MAG: hypothetical protein AVDCRST_MAG30-1337, partial [uncultured Solirubrobacteraceae bacterium]
GARGHPAPGRNEPRRRHPGTGARDVPDLRLRDLGPEVLERDGAPRRSGSASLVVPLGRLVARAQAQLRGLPAVRDPARGRRRDRRLPRGRHDGLDRRADRRGDRARGLVRRSDPDHPLQPAQGARAAAPARGARHPPGAPPSPVGEAI